MVKDVTVRTLFDLTVKTVRRGSIVYTDRFRSYDSLMFCGYRHFKGRSWEAFCVGESLHQWVGGGGELGEGEVDQTPWDLQGDLSFIFEGIGVSLQPSSHGYP